MPVFMAAKSGYDLGGGFVPGRGGGSAMYCFSRQCL